MFTVTLTPNRSNPRRYSRYVIYRKVPDGRLMPFRVSEEDGRLTIDSMLWSQIKPAEEAEPDFAAAWRQHVRQFDATASG